MLPDASASALTLPRMVVDATVVLKWVFREKNREPAAALLTAFEAGEVGLISPASLRNETANAIASRVRRKELGAQQATTAYGFLMDRLPLLIDDPDLTTEAWKLALQYNMSVSDTLYLALATRYRCDVVTADRRFHRLAIEHYPFVRLLEDLPGRPFSE